MSRVKSKDTVAELRVRRLAHSLGLRYRLHRRDLPGTPDLVFPKHRVVVFVHGCFWHRHPRCKKATTPRSRVQFWQSKFKRNVARDQQAVKDLEALGWAVAVIWECESKDEDTVLACLREVFGSEVRQAPFESSRP